MEKMHPQECVAVRPSQFAWPLPLSPQRPQCGKRVCAPAPGWPASLAPAAQSGRAAVGGREGRNLFLGVALLVRLRHTSHRPQAALAGSGLGSAQSASPGAHTAPGAARVNSCACCSEPRVEAPTLQSEETRQDFLEEEQERNDPWGLPLTYLCHHLPASSPHPQPGHKAGRVVPESVICLSALPAQVTIFLPTHRKNSPSL